MKTTRYLAAVALLAIATTVATAIADTAVAEDSAAQKPVSKVEYNQPTQPLGEALKQFGKTSGYTVMVESSLARGLTAPALRGSYTPKEALDLILASTGLRAEYLGSRTVAIRPEAAGVNGATTGLEPADQMRMATADKSGHRNDDIRESTEETRNQVTVQGERGGRAPFAGSSIDLARTEDDALPFTTFTAEEIELSGASNLAEFLRNRLSQNYTRVIPEENHDNGSLRPGGSIHTANQLGFSNGGGGALGVREVAILVNGRRLPNRFYGQAADSSATTGDFRGIPLHSIERVEVLASAGSALYGDQALGGVINIITKRNYRGGSVVAGFENPVDADAAKRSVELSYGMPLRGDSSLRFSFSGSDSDPLTYRDRADVTVDRYRTLLMQRDPARITGGSASWFVPPLGATPNIRSIDGSGLFGDGTSAITSVPASYTGGQGVAPFVSRQGVFNLELAEGGNAVGSARAPFGTGTRSAQFTAGFDTALGKNWQFTLEYLRNRNRQRGYVSNYESMQFVDGASPVNPFGKAVFVTWYDPRLDRPELQNGLSTSTDQFTASLRGDLGRWRSVADFSYSLDKDSYRYSAFQPAGSTWGDAVNDGTYNPFIDMSMAAPAAASFYEGYDREVTRTGGSTRNYQVTAKISGPVIGLPAGTVQLTSGLEWVRQNRHDVHSSIITTNNATGLAVRGFIDQNYGPVFFDFNTYSVYSEIDVPLLSATQQVPMVNRLGLFASGRAGRQVRESSVVSDATYVLENGVYTFTYSNTPVSYETDPRMYAVGVQYEMIPGIALRASRSLGYKPPLFTEVTPRSNFFSATVVDRRTGQTVVLSPAMYLSGGHPDLEAESGASTNLGLVLTARVSGGLRFSADYTEGTRDNAITSLSPQSVLNLELNDPRMAARVQRNASGAIVSVDARSINLRQIESKALTLNFDQYIDGVGAGRVALNVGATRNMSFRIQTSAGGATEEQVNNPEGSYGDYFVKWNANGQVRWEGGRFTAGWSTRYFDEVFVPASYYLAQGGDRLKPKMEHDLMLSYRFPAAGSAGRTAKILEQSALTVGIKNIFDGAPRFYGLSQAGYYPGESISGRTMWLRVRKDY